MFNLNTDKLITRAIIIGGFSPILVTIGVVIIESFGIRVPGLVGLFFILVPFTLAMALGALIVWAIQLKLRKSENPTYVSISRFLYWLIVIAVVSFYIIAIIGLIDEIMPPY